MNRKQQELHLGLPHGCTGSVGAWIVLHCCPAHQQRGGLQVEQPGLQPVPTAQRFGPQCQPQGASSDSSPVWQSTLCVAVDVLGSRPGADIHPVYEKTGQGAVTAEAAPSSHRLQLPRPVCSPPCGQHWLMLGNICLLGLRVLLKAEASGLGTNVWVSTRSVSHFIMRALPRSIWNCSDEVLNCKANFFD